MFLKVSQIHLRRSLFFIIRDFNTGVFLWNLQKFWEYIFLQNTSGDCLHKLKYGKKSTTLNGEGLKRGTKKLNIKKPFQTAFTCPNSMIKTEKHSAKYETKTKNKNTFCKSKCVKLNFYKCAHFLLFLLLSTLWICNFHCFPTSFLLLYLSFDLGTSPPFPHFSHFDPDSRPRF